MKFSIDTKIYKLLESPEAMKVLRKYLGDLVDDPMVNVAKRVSLRIVSEVAPDKVPPRLLKEIDKELRAIK